MKITEFFQKGYYINLPSRPERKARFEQEMTRAGLGGFFEWSPGVSDMERARAAQPHEKEYVHRGLCCSKAFYNVFQKIKDSGVERAVVFEDDAKIEPEGLRLVESALDQLQSFPNWDMIYFGGLVIDNKVERVSENLVRANTILTLHAVGYNKKCIDHLLTYVPYRDCIYDGWIGDHHNLEKYIVYPMAMTQHEGPSDIDVSGNALTANHWKSAYNKLEHALQPNK